MENVFKTSNASFHIWGILTPQVTISDKLCYCGYFTAEPCLLRCVCEICKYQILKKL